LVKEIVVFRNLIQVVIEFLNLLYIVKIVHEMFVFGQNPRRDEFGY